MSEPAHPCVLVVDSHPDTADSLADLLRLHGYWAVVAHTAREALDAADSAPPDVVLLDLRLPDLDGCQVARWLREQARVRDRDRLLLVAVTECDREEDFQRSAAAGFDRHLLKPVAPDVLVRMLSEYRLREGECDYPVEWTSTLSRAGAPAGSPP